MRYYTSCSCCGYQLGRSCGGTETEVTCPKCEARLEYIVTDKKVTVTLIEPSHKQKYAERIETYANALNKKA